MGEGGPTGGPETLKRIITVHLDEKRLPENQRLASGVVQITHQNRKFEAKKPAV